MLPRVRQDVAQLRGDCQEVLQQKEEHEELLRRREKELASLKGALKEEVETHDQYVAALKEEYEKEFQNLLGEFDLFKQVMFWRKQNPKYNRFTGYWRVLPHRATFSWVKRGPEQKRRGSRLIAS